MAGFESPPLEVKLKARSGFGSGGWVIIRRNGRSTSFFFLLSVDDFRTGHRVVIEHAHI